MREALERISAAFPITPRDAGEYAHFKAFPLTVELTCCFAEGLGSVSILRGKAMAGLMRMDTLVINAYLRDVPLFSYDGISAMGNHTVLTEYYDTMLEPAAFDDCALLAVKESVACLPDHDLGEHWYDPIKLSASFAKKTKKTALPRLNEVFFAALDAYLTLAQEKPLLNAQKSAEKQANAASYVSGLLQNGGPSTDAFVKALGAERTKTLFTRFVFGTEISKQ